MSEQDFNIPESPYSVTTIERLDGKTITTIQSIVPEIPLKDMPARKIKGISVTKSGENTIISIVC